MRHCFLLLVFFALLCMPRLAAQTSYDWWYFGHYAGMHFEPTGPVADPNSGLHAVKGCASISDPLGNLLMYANGDSILNRNHEVMPNGNDLIGYSGTQSVVIVPQPQNPDIYYVFTLGNYDTIGLHYSVVNLTLDGGLGDVDTNQKNVPLRKGVIEKQVAVQHANGEDVWLVLMPLASDSVLSFPITAAGLNTTPVTSTMGDTSLNSIGQLKASPNGKMLAAAQPGEVQLMRFDNETGVASNGIAWSPTNPFGMHGIEFSPDGNLLYATARQVPHKRLFQFDISSYDAVAISASEVLIAEGMAVSMSVADLQLGPDNKIYVAKEGVNAYLSSIESPNAPGLACSFIDSSIFLGVNWSIVGLPGRVNTFGRSALNTSNDCQPGPMLFEVDTLNYDFIAWNFGDPSSGASNLDTGFIVSHVFSDTGFFTVTLVIFRGAVIDTTETQVRIFPGISLDLGPDTALCTAAPVLLNAAQPLATYLWSDGSTDSTLTVTADTTVSVTVFGVCDTLSDTITVIYSDTFSFNLVDSIVLCEGNPATLSPGVQQDHIIYLWSTPAGVSTSDSVFVSQSGLYSVTASNACDTVIDTVVARVDPLPVASLPADTTLCSQDVVVLTRPVNDSVIYTWSDSSDVLIFQVDSTGSFWLAAENNCGFTVDTFNLIVFSGFDISLGVDTQQCPDDSILLSARYPGAEYVWSTGATSDTIWTNRVEESYSVTVTLDSCVATDRINIQITDLACKNIDCKVDFYNVFSPNGDGVNDVFRLTSDCDILQYDLRIYNRWGQLVHQSSYGRQGWDGFIHGEPASEGVYFYVLEFRDGVIVDVDRKSFQGSFTLIR